MVLRPQLEDIKVIGYYLGKIIIGLGFFMWGPVIIGFLFREVNPLIDFMLGFFACVFLGNLLILFCRTERDLSWMHGMVVVSLSWLVAAFLGAIPLFLSGHYVSFLDSYFEAMSGLSTTGLTLVQDLDHLSRSHNFWRHIGPFIGGQGIIIVALSLFVKGATGAFKIYVGEARDERLLPNVIQTSRFIWLISFVYLIIGTLVLGVAGIQLGMKPSSAFFHGACIFMAGFDTAGFAPQSQSILYYHSFAYEIAIMVIMVMGALNFNLHYQLWTGNFREIWRNIETKTFGISVLVLFFITAIGLDRSGVYPSVVMSFRKGFFQFISAHTTTGYMTIYARQFVKEWGDLAWTGIICAMGIGACICSSSGGIKVMRLGIIFKALTKDIKKLMLPESAVVAQKFHHIKEILLEDKQVRAILLVTLAYIILYALGTLIGVYLGHPFLESLFESVSAGANEGFSCGITQANMPAILKLTYIFQMWAGRLEFMSVFVLIGFFVAWAKGK